MVVLMRVVYLSQSPRVSKVFLSPSQALSAICPGVDQFCITFGRDFFPGTPPEPEDKTFINTDVTWLPLTNFETQEKQKLDVWQRFNAAIECVLEELRPDVVVVPHDFPGYHEVAVRLATRRQIASVVLQEALMDFTVFGGKRIVSLTFESSEFDDASVMTNSFLAPWKKAFDYQVNFLAKVKVKIKYIFNTCISSLQRQKQKASLKSSNCITPSPTGHFGGSNATRIGVIGDYYRRKLLRYQLPPSQVVTVGYTRGDLVHDSLAIPREELARELGINPHDPFVAIISQDFDNWHWPRRIHHHDAILEACIAMQRLHPEYQFILFAHPGEDLETVKDFMHGKGLEKLSIFKGTKHFPSVCEQAVMVVGFWSTCLIEAMRIGVPILTLDYVMLDFFIPNMIQWHAVAPVLRREELEEQIQKLSDQDYVNAMIQNQKKVAVDIFGVNDGQAGQRAAHLIVEAVIASSGEKICADKSIIQT